MSGKRAKYPRVSDIRIGRTCDVCRAARSSVTVLIQTGWTRGDDEHWHLCSSCYAATGAKELPEKTTKPSVHGRGEALIDAWRAWRDGVKA